MALTGQDVLNTVNKLPLPQKIAVIAVAAVLITAGNWYFLVDPKLTEITQKQSTLRTLEDELIQKQSIANNLAQFKREKEILERRLQQALTELPNEANIDSIPIVMSVTGNYHEIGVFLDALSKLARIVNVTNIKMNSAKVQNDKLIVSASYVATTFRFLPEAPKPAAPPGAAK